MANQNRNVNYLQVTATQAKHEQFVQMIHETDERKELLDGVKGKREIDNRKQNHNWRMNEKFT